MGAMPALRRNAVNAEGFLFLSISAGDKLWILSPPRHFAGVTRRIRLPSATVSSQPGGGGV